MGNYAEIRGKCSRGKYASGGRVAAKRAGPKTVINIMTPPAAPAPGPVGAPPVGAPPVGAPPAPPMPSPAAAGPVPPAAAAMALGQMQGKPGAPGAFRNGGRIPPATKQKAGAAGGRGRLQKTAAAKK